MVGAAAAIAESYGCAPEQVWVTWDEIAPGMYVEGSKVGQQQPLETHPPIGELIAFEGKSDAVIASVLAAAAGALTQALGIPGNVFITYREAKSGQVIAGDGGVRR